MTKYINAEHEERVSRNLKTLADAKRLKKIGLEFIEESSKFEYSYNFSWMGVPVIQFPQDLVAMQEIIWNVRPRVIVETGIAHGGSLVFYASMLKMAGIEGEVIGVDIDIREVNRKNIERHPMYDSITMFEGSSIDPQIQAKVRARIDGRGPVLVCLDSNHTHDHVLEELQLYSPLVTSGSYLVVFDTIIEDIDDALFSHRPWCTGDNPKTAVQQFLKENDRFEVDFDVDNKLQISVAPSGYLKCVR